jgi:transcriptional regulator with XRE-family HTH domain
MNIGKSINVALAKREMTRFELSRSAKISQPYLSLIINGKAIPKISTIERIAEATSFSVSEFIALGE